MSATAADLHGVSRESLAAARERLDELLADSSVEPSALGRELFEVVHLLDREHALRRALSDPSHPVERKTQVVRSLLGDQLGASALALVEHVVGAHWARGADLPDAVENLAVLAQVSQAERAGHLHDLEDELFRFRRIVDAQPRLRAILTDPAIPAERKRGLLGELLEGKVRPATLHLVAEVATYPRGRGFDRGLQVYSGIAAERRERLIAFVRTAAPLDDEHRRRLADVLSRAYGHEVHLNVEVDPDVMGGLSVRVGDEVIDGTIAGRLDEVRRRLSR